MELDCGSGPFLPQNPKPHQPRSSSLQLTGPRAEQNSVNKSHEHGHPGRRQTCATSSHQRARHAPRRPNQVQFCDRLYISEPMLFEGIDHICSQVAVVFKKITVLCPLQKHEQSISLRATRNKSLLRNYKFLRVLSSGRHCAADVGDRAHLMFVF